MKIDFTTVLTDLEGKPILKGEVPITLKEAALEALLATFPNDQDGANTGKGKFERFQLALKCEGTAELSVEEVATIKKRIGEAWGSLIVGRAWGLLEG